MDCEAGLRSRLAPLSESQMIESRKSYVDHHSGRVVTVIAKLSEHGWSACVIDAWGDECACKDAPTRLGATRKALIEARERSFWPFRMEDA